MSQRWSRKKLWTAGVAGIVVIAVAVAGVIWWMHSRVPGDVDVRPEFAPGHEWLREDYQAGFGEPRAIEGEFCDIVDGVVVATEWHTEDDPYSTGDLYTSVSTVGTDVETGKELWRTEGVACWG